MSRQFTRDFLIEVQKGNIPGHSMVHKFGRNNDVRTGFVPVAFGGEYRTPQAAAAKVMRIAAGNANDAAAGTGAREVTLEGTDELGAYATEALATAGASASADTTTKFMRLFRAYVSSSGTYASATAGSHVANIVIDDSEAVPTIYATIDSADFPKSQTEIGVYAVPTGKTAYLISAYIETDTTKVTDIILFKRESILDAAAPYEAMRVVNTHQINGQGRSDLDIKSPVIFNASTDFGYMAKVTSGSATVTVHMEILLVDN